MTSYDNIMFARMIHFVIILFVFTSLGFTTHRHMCVVMKDNSCDMACSENPVSPDEPAATKSATAFNSPLCHIDTLIGGTAVREALTGKDYKSDNQKVINFLFTLQGVSVRYTKPSDIIHHGILSRLLIIPSTELFLLNEAYLL
jgi:hypothetical protein